MSQLNLFANAPPPGNRRRGRPGWTMVDGVPRLKQCGGVWRHDASGWLVKHCGHPTANWPYYGLRPGKGRMLLTGGWGKGLAFRTLALAQEAVERELAHRRIAARRRSAQRTKSGR